MIDQTAQLDRARRLIAELRKRLTELQAAAGPEPIAIIGMACRFPGEARDCDGYWRMIVAGDDAIRPVPPARANDVAADALPQAALLDDIETFDAAFFDVPPREATHMDPQQRLFLEVAWHALEDAGQTRAQLAASSTGVFVGVHNHSSGYLELQTADASRLNEYTALGAGHDVIAGRLAYFLDLRGPCAAINTACSSSLVAVHMACQSLQARDCRMAVVGGVNLILGPVQTKITALGAMFADDGRCKTFDARANGYGRGEGCGVVVLKRLSDAQADRDRVLAVIRGSYVNQDGRTNGLTAPNGLSQQALLRHALSRAGVEASQVGYIETHGTGTALGDPIEVEAIAAVYGAADKDAPRCALGSAKSNINHLEGAAGIAGLIKAVLSLKAGVIPPVAGFQRLNPHISLDGTRLFVPTEAMPWPADTPRIAAVSAFGWSGVNAHALLEEGPRPIFGGAVRKTRMMVSASDPSAVAARALDLAEAVQHLPDSMLESFAWTATVRRSTYQHRLVVEGSSCAELANALRRAAHEAQCNAGATAAVDQFARLVGDEAFGADAQVISLPAHRFRRRRYWVAESVPAVPAASVTTSDAPLDWYHETAWRHAEAPAPQPADRLQCVIIGGTNGYAERLASLVRQGDGVALFGSARDAHFSGLLNALDPGAWTLIDLRALDPGEGTTCTQALRLAQQVVDLDKSVSECSTTVRPRIWIVTRGAHAVVAGDVPDLATAPLWGLCRSLSLDNPDRWGGLVDLDPVGEPDLTELYHHICGETDAADEFAFRGGVRYANRISPATAVPSDALRLDPAASYLVVGAFGGIGPALATWLAGRGARHLVLTGRSFDQGSDTQHANLALRRSLQELGTEARLERCDVSDPLAVKAMLARIGQTMPPLRGIFHLAAAATVPVSTIEAADLAAAFRPKVAGALILDEQSRDLKLDHFVLFSSAAGALGARGQGHYAAANTFLDALAARRRACGLPGLSIEWGLLGESEAPHVPYYRRVGLIPMAPRTAFNAMARLMSEQRTGAVARQPVVAALDGDRLRSALELRGRKRFLSELAAKEGLQETDQARALRAQLCSMPDTSRRERIIELLAADVRAVMELEPDDPINAERGFFDMGMDSLMTVALRARLEDEFGISLSSSVAMDYPSIAALAAHFDTLLVGTGHSSPPVAVERGTHTEVSTAPVLHDMSDEEVSNALAAELRQLDLESLG